MQKIKWFTSKDWLEDQLLTKKRSVKDIAKEFDVEEWMIREHIKKFNINLHRDALNRTDFIKNLYLNTEMSISDIAVMCDVDCDKVKYRLINMGVYHG